MKLYWQDPDIQKQITDSLQKNKVLITTTDTVLGLLANVTQSGFDNLNQIKGGRQQKPYIVLISDISKLSYFTGNGPLPTQIQKILSVCWPGPLTAVFGSKPDLPDFLRSGSNTVAVRCPNHPGLLGVLQSFNGLFSTSANKSGYPQPTSIGDVDQELISKVDFVVNDRGGSQLQPSTILDFSRFGQDKKIYLLRHGAFSLHEIEKISGIKLNL